MSRSRSGKIAVICARFNEHVTSALLRGAQQELMAQNIADEHVLTFYVPGAFELPLAALIAARRSDVRAVICLGAVIRGDTPHFDHVCAAAARGILEAGMQTGKPVIFGVLTTDTVEQAFERAGGKVGNKGNEAANAALRMLELLEQLEEKAG